jgi:hypothetical protein
MLGLSLMHVTGWAEADRLMAAGATVVILWSASAVWACATPHLARAMATLAGLATAGGAVLLAF